MITEDTRNGALDELFDGCQALGDAIIRPEVPECGYAHGYLDGWADAMWHASLAAEGKRPKATESFPLLLASSIRTAARKALKAHRRGDLGGGGDD